MKKAYVRFFLACFILYSLDTYTQTKVFPYRVGHFLGQVVIDAIDLHYNIFSTDSAKIITGFMPFYLLTRLLDKDIQCHFYDPKYHKNINQFPNKCHRVAKFGVSIPIVFLSSLAIWGWTEDIRYTGRMTGIGLPFVHSGKNIIKKARARICLRPWHEDFSPKKRSSGGFPSGHMANVTYMVTLWGLRNGPRWAIPLSLAAGFVFADFINQNRHYVSQMIAGAALGVLYGVAASKIVDNRLAGNFSFSVTLNNSNQPCCEIGYSF